MRGWRNWQTHYLEVVAPARAWRFKSSPAHQSALSSVVEHRLDVTRVVGSIPTARTDNLKINYAAVAQWIRAHP